MSRRTLLDAGLVTDLYVTVREPGSAASALAFYDGPPLVRRRLLSKAGARHRRRASASSTWCPRPCTRLDCGSASVRPAFGVEPRVALDVPSPLDG